MMVRNWLAFALAAAALVVLSLRPLAAADEHAAPPADLQEQIAGLVRDLGSPEFAKREQASRQLIALGIVTREPLMRAAGGPDAEVRARARAVLAKVCESDFESRLEAFSADYDGSRRQSLPAWEQFSAQFGASNFARELFVEMQRAEPELLEAMAAGPKQASEALAERTREILDGARESLMTLGTQATFLWVGSSEGVAVDEQTSMGLYPYMVHSTYQRTSKSALWPTVLKKVVARWITKDGLPAMATQNLIFAVQMDMKGEALAIASRVLSTEKETNARQTAILILGRFGNKSHHPLLEKLLDDATVSAMVPTEEPPHQLEMQIRDLALAVLLILTNQDLRSYGYRSTQAYGPTPFQVGALAFPDAAAREAAFKKWAAWRAAHPDA